LHVEGKDITSTINKFLKILGNLNNAFKPNLALKQYQLKVCNILDILSLLYGSEIWTLKQSNVCRVRKAEMKFMRCTAGYSFLDIRKN
jgi:hypothetical protein